MEWLRLFVSTVEHSPLRVRIAFSVAVLAGAVGVIGVLVSGSVEQGQANAGSSVSYLKITGASLQGDSHDAIKVKAIVNPEGPNRQEYWYPNVLGVDFVTVGPEMGPETFLLSPQPVSSISFEIHVSDGTVLMSTENKPVAVDGVLNSYNVRKVIDHVKSAIIGGTVYYQISKTRP
jgi:hypothetical protein